MRVKYSPLPWVRPDIIGLVKVDPGRVDPEPMGRVLLRNERRVVRVLTLVASRWSVRWKSWVGVLLRESEFMWWRGNERVVEFAGYGSGFRVVDSGWESVGG